MSREERLALLIEGRRCPAAQHNWRPPGLIASLRRIPRALRTEVLARDGGRCLCCGAGDELKVDLVHPRVHGGPLGLSNLQTLCAACAELKGDRCLDFRPAAAPRDAPDASPVRVAAPVAPGDAGDELAA